MTEQLATDRVTALRRAWRHDDAEQLIKEELSGAAAEVELGRIAVQRGRYALAEEHVERALAISPDCQAAIAWRVAILSKRLRYAEARAVADKALAVAPKAHLVRLARARVADDETGDVQYLLDEVEAILQTDPDHVGALEQRISALGALARYDDAAAAAEDAIRRHPGGAALLLCWANVLAGIGRYPEAVEHCERALTLQPGYVDAQYDISSHLQDAERHDEALANAERAVLANPEVSRLHLAMGWTLAGIGDHHRALSHFEKAITLDLDIVLHHEWVASTLRDLGRWDEALEVIRAGRERFPDSVGLLLEKAWVQSAVDDLASATAASAEALALDPAGSAAIRCHVDMLQKSKRYQEAEAVARSGIEIRPHDAAMPLSLGWVYRWQDRDQEALDFFRLTVVLRPNSAWFISCVCAALRWLYRHTEAERLLAEAIPRLSDPAPLVLQSALVHEDAGRYHEALVLYQQINEKTPRYTTAWDKRVAVLRNQRRLAEAEQVARQAVDVNPFNADLRLARALVHEVRGGESSAITSLREACADIPHSAMLAAYLALYLRIAGEFDEAWETLSRLPDTASTERERIALWRAARDHRRAIDIATAAVSRYPHDARFRIALGELRSEQDDDEAALAEYEAALTIDKTSRTAVRGKATCLRKLRRFPEAEHFLIAEIARLPNYTVIRLELAWTYGQMERRDDGIAQYEQALEIDPRNPLLSRGYANALTLVGRWQDAEQILSNAVEQFPHDAGIMTRRGELCDTLNRREEALAWFDKALAIVPRATWPLKAKSATLRSLGRFDEAERLLAPALERRIVTSDVVVEWGWVLRDRGQLTRARQAFERALTLTVGRRDRADVLHGLGWVAFFADDFQQAAIHFREAFDEHPDSLDAKLGLAWTLVRDRQPNGEAEAERLCLEVLDRRPRRHLAHTCLGVLYTHQNDLPQAEHHLRRAIEIDPYGGSYVDLGALFVQMDRFEEAEILLCKALDRDWYDSQAHIELGGLYLQRDFDADEAGDDAKRAAQHFRQALVIDPSRGAAAIGLSLSLIRSPGDLLAAERVLRDALNRTDCDQPRWQMLVALARLFIRHGDATQRRDLYLEALNCAQQAIELAESQADPHYVAGVAAYKVGESGPEAQARPFYRRRALRYFRECLRYDPRHTEARRVMNLAEQSLAITRTSLVGSMLMMFVATALLVVMWIGFFLTNKVSTVVITTLTPVLVGLVALGFVLPFLVRLKLPGGVEADLSASLNQVTSGPTGEVSIGPGRLVGRTSDSSGGSTPLGTGPRGELPRLG